jgi:NADPH:quinone reductase-like Zn-dependent oxidoreductase
MTEQTMIASYVTKLGGADNIEVGALPVPSPGPSEVLVRVQAAAVNLADAYVFSGTFPTAMPMPYIVGTDLVGTVVETGSEAIQSGLFRPGQQVWCNSMGRGGRQGPTAEYAAVPADRLYRMPEVVDPHVAVALAQPAGTAYLGWFVHARLRPGETVFVGGGAGNIGTAAIQLARRGGARVIASARPDDFDKCRAAGAEAVFDFTDSGLADRVADHAPEGVDVVWETSGHHDFDLVVRVAAIGCRVLLTADSGDQPVPLAQFYMKDVSVLGFVISLATVSDLADAAGLINQMLEHGQLTTQIAESVPLAQAAAAHQRIGEGGVRGRLLVTP